MYSDMFDRTEKGPIRHNLSNQRLVQHFSQEMHFRLLLLLLLRLPTTKTQAFFWCSGVAQGQMHTMKENLSHENNPQASYARKIRVRLVCGARPHAKLTSQWLDNNM